MTDRFAWQPGDFQAEWPAGPIGEAGLDERQMARLVAAAVRTGRIHPRNADAWLTRLARDRREAGAAITDMLALWPDPEVAAGLAR